MGPAILARAAIAPFAAKIHGSALEYTVKPHPDRFLPFAREGMEAAAGVLVGSAHTAESLWRALRPFPISSPRLAWDPPEWTSKNSARWRGKGRVRERRPRPQDPPLPPLANRS